MPVITEVVDTRDVELVSRYPDILQIAPEICRIFVCSVNAETKAGVAEEKLSSTIEEWLMAAEYVMSEGDARVNLM